MADFRDALAAQLIGQGFRQSPTSATGFANMGQMLVGALLSKHAQDAKKIDQTKMFEALSTYQSGAEGSKDAALEIIKSMKDPSQANALATALFKPTTYGAPVDELDAQGNPIRVRYGSQPGQRYVVPGSTSKVDKKPYLKDGALVWATPREAAAGNMTPYTKDSYFNAYDMSGEQPVLKRITQGEFDADPDRYKLPVPGLKFKATAGEHGTDFAVDTSGGPDGEGGGLSKGATTENDKDLVKLGNQRLEFARITEGYRERYHDWKERGSKWIDVMRDKASGLLPALALSPEEAKDLGDFTTYMGDLAQSFSTILKRISGVAVNPQEMERSEAWIPNKNDSPVEARSKIDRMIEFTDQAIAKGYYIKKHGLTVEDIGVEQMPSIMQARGDLLAKELSAKGVEGEALKAAVKRELAKEFGLVQ